jgi:hypothetical protein
MWLPRTFLPPQNIEATIGLCFFALFYAYIFLLFTFLAMESMNGSQSGSGKKKLKYFLAPFFLTYYSKYCTFVLFHPQSLKGTFRSV